MVEQAHFFKDDYEFDYGQGFGFAVGMTDLDLSAKDQVLDPSIGHFEFYGYEHNFETEG